MIKLLLLFCGLVFLYIIIKIMCKIEKSDYQNKIHIYHMPNCGHCQKLMEGGPFQQLVNAFKGSKVEVKDFLYGRDNEANKYSAFPVIKLIKNNKELEYNGPREATNIIEAFNKL
jgi:hypothetical protein